MTCREKLKLEHPDMIRDSFLGGCVGCPQDYGYRKRAEWCRDTRYPQHERCTRCWNRECVESTAKIGSLKQAVQEYEKRHSNRDEFIAYCEADVAATQKMYEISRTHYGYFPAIKNVIFNDPATIVYWTDDTKTVVKVKEGDTFDPEKGLAMAVCEKAFGSKSNSHKVFKKWLPEETPMGIACIALTKLSETMSKLTIPKLNVLIKKRTNEDEKND